MNRTHHRKLMLFLAAAVLILQSGCLRTQAHTGQSPANPQQTQSATKAPTASPAPSKTETASSEGSGSAADDSLLNTAVSFADLDIEPFLEEIRTHSVSYPYEERFHTAEALSRYAEMKEYDSDADLKFISNGKIKEKELRKSIKQNNAAFLSEHPSITRYTELSDADFELVFGMLVKTLNARMHIVDIPQLDDNLSLLMIFNNKDSSYGATTYDDILLLINVDNCRKNGGEEKLLSTAAHETNHLASYCSAIEKEHEGYSYNVGMSYYFDDLEFNPLFFNWLNEAAAEKLAQAEFPERDPKIDMYKEFVKTLDSLTLSVILDDQTEGLTLPELNCQNDPEKLFALFDAQTQEEKEEIVNMMCSYNIVYDANITNKSLDQAKDFRKAAGITDENAYRRQVCAASAETLTKNFYRTLAVRLQTAENITLKDLFVLLTFEECDLNRVGVNMVSSSYVYGKNQNTDHFIDMYTDIQHSFFALLSECTGLSEDELFQAYDSFYVKHKYEFTVDTKLYTPTEQAFAEEILKSRSDVSHYDNFFTYKEK